MRNCHTSDAAQIVRIYNHYVQDTVATFEEAPISEDEMAQRIARVTGELPWLVWEDSKSILGYAYATRWKNRSAYRFSVESTIYLSPQSFRRGIGTRLYDALLVDLRSRGVHCAIGGISLPNAASVALHERLGFSKIGHFREVGRKFGRWVDVGYWERIL